MLISDANLTADQRELAERIRADAQHVEIERDEAGCITLAWHDPAKRAGTGWHVVTLLPSNIAALIVTNCGTRVVPGHTCIFGPADPCVGCAYDAGVTQ